MTSKPYDPESDLPRNLREATRVLLAFVRTAPGRLPERVERACALLDAVKPPMPADEKTEVPSALLNVLLRQHADYLSMICRYPRIGKTLAFMMIGNAIACSSTDANVDVATLLELLLAAYRKDGFEGAAAALGLTP